MNSSSVRLTETWLDSCWGKALTRGIGRRSSWISPWSLPTGLIKGQNDARFLMGGIPPRSWGDSARFHATCWLNSRRNQANLGLASVVHWLHRERGR